jgi:uncharacterized protein YndB with AHSA1/START domain
MSRVSVPALSLIRSFRTPVLDVWAGITRPERLARWLGRTDLELTPGAEFVMEHANGDTTRGHVLDVVPPVRLELGVRGSPSGPERRLALLLEGDGPGSRATVVTNGFRNDIERKREHRFWSEALAALRTTLHEERDASSWGADIPILSRMLLPRAGADLWPLISTGPGLDKWVAHVDRFDAAQGGMFRLTSRYHGRQIVEEGRIEEITPESRVALSWEWIGEGWGAPTRVEFLIEAEAPGSSLSVIHSGFEALAADRQFAARRNYAAAWPDVLSDLRRLVAPVTA